MIHPDNKTIDVVFNEAIEQYPDNLFLMVPGDPERSYHPLGYQITYQAASNTVQQIKDLLSTAGYGHGHRIAILLENRPEFVFVKLACNSLGIQLCRLIQIIDQPRSHTCFKTLYQTLLST